TVIKTALTGAALAATAWSRALGAKLDQAGEVPVEGGTDPSGETPEDVATVQRQLTVLQGVTPPLPGALLALNARMGEQQRPAQVSGGLLGRLRPGRAACPGSLAAARFTKEAGVPDRHPDHDLLRELEPVAEQ